MRALIRAAVLLALLGAVVVPAAMADTVTIPPGIGLPWTDPNHQGPLELLADQIAGSIAGRSVSVRCEGDTDWNTLAGQFGFNPSYELGYVRFQYYVQSRTIASDPQLTELSPNVCSALQDFGIAAVKPTKCQPLIAQTKTVYVNQRYRVKVRVKVKGKWVTRKVWRTRRVATTVTTNVPGDPAPCYLGNKQTAAGEPTSYWQAYSRYALGMLALAHESIHLTEARGGVRIDSYLPLSETHANCYGLQWVSYVAQQLGATSDDAQAIAKYDYDIIYPGYQGVTFNGSAYWSADCRSGGPLDLTPNDGNWP